MRPASLSYDNLTVFCLDRQSIACHTAIHPAKWGSPLCIMSVCKPSAMQTPRGRGPPTMRITTKPQTHGRITDQAQPFWPNRSYVPTNTAQNYGRIENPVANTGPKEALLPSPQQPPTPPDAVPSFIDPGQ